MKRPIKYGLQKHTINRAIKHVIGIAVFSVTTVSMKFILNYWISTNDLFKSDTLWAHWCRHNITVERMLLNKWWFIAWIQPKSFLTKVVLSWELGVHTRFWHPLTWLWWLALTWIDQIIPENIDLFFIKIKFYLILNNIYPKSQFQKIIFVICEAFMVSRISCQEKLKSSEAADNFWSCQAKSVTWH